MCVESAACIEYEKVGVSCKGGLAGVEGDGGGVGAGLVLYNLDTDAFGPDCKLLRCGGTERG